MLFRNSIILLVALSVAASCNNNDIDCGELSVFNTIMDSSVIGIDTIAVNDTILEDFSVISGNNLVAMHEFNLPNCVHTDEGYDRYIYFEFDPAVDTAFYSGDLLKDIKCYYSSMGYMPDYDIPVTDGSVAIEKTNLDSWMITLDLQVYDYIAEKTITVETADEFHLGN